MEFPQRLSQLWLLSTETSKTRQDVQDTNEFLHWVCILCACNLFCLNCAGHKITNVPAIPQIDQISFAGIARNDS